MHHDVPLIATIAMSLMLAFAFGMAAVRLHLSPLVGYLVAGIILGPFTPGFSADLNLAHQLAEIGVILLMFGVGLHFSIRDLWDVRWIAIPGAVVQITVATGLGTVLALFWGWSLTAGIIFGLALSVASTVVLLRALEERHALQTLNGRIAVGWLVVEDLAMVVALVLLPPLAAMGGAATAGSGSFQEVGLALAVTLGKVGLFIAIILVVGRRVVPWVLEHVFKRGSRELFSLAVLALALGIAYVASALFGVSFALGAFFAGLVMSESDLSHKATADSLPLKDAFAVLFFVAVGMLFDPAILVKDPWPVMAVLGIILIGKSLAAFAIVLAFRYPVSTALTVSASLAQIGEFSFILVALGVALGVLPLEGQTYILAGALLSIALNPLVFRLLGPMETWMRDHPRVINTLERSDADPLTVLSPGTEPQPGHTIIVGFGRVGANIAQAFDRHGTPYVVIEHNRQLVQRLRKKGIAAIYGDAGVSGVLEAAHLATATALVAAVPDGGQVRRVVKFARACNPDIKLVVRTHSDAEREHLERQGVSQVVMGERELALAMTRHALASLQVGEEACP